MYPCVACDEIFTSRDAVYMDFDCGHAFCLTCVESFFRSSLKNGQFPPTCCGHLAAFSEVARVRSILPQDLRAKLDDRLEEVNAVDRTYCSVPTCSSFMKPAHISGNDATCPVCERVTCVACKAAAHAGECSDRAEDEATQQLLHTAMSQGWRRCGKCRSLIERIDGCNHML